MEAARLRARPIPAPRFVKGVSGNPSGKRLLKDRADALYRVMAADLAPSTATDEILLRHTCLLIARAERVNRLRDIDGAIRTSGEARRLLESLRRRAASAPKEPPTKPWSDITAKAQDDAKERRARASPGTPRCS
jgi:hypothetical protein